MADTRVVYGARCVWWDTIDKVAIKPVTSLQPVQSPVGSIINVTGLPCCPHCSGVLFEMDSIEEWNSQVDKYEAEKPEPGYRKFMDWLRGKCFKTQEEAYKAYKELN